MDKNKKINDIIQSVDQPIWIVTASAPDRRRGGLVATWVMTNSIDDNHPTMMIALARNHFTTELIDASQSFALHLLKESQVDVALNFAIGSGRERDKLSELQSSIGESGSPILKRCDSWMDCNVTARLQAADRIYYWANVIDGARREIHEDPLLTKAGLIRIASLKQRGQLRSNLEQDIKIQRPMIEEWLANLPDYLQP